MPLHGSGPERPQTVFVGPFPGPSRSATEADEVWLCARLFGGVYLVEMGLQKEQNSNKRVHFAIAERNTGASTFMAQKTLVQRRALV